MMNHFYKGVQVHERPFLEGDVPATGNRTAPTTIPRRHLGPTPWLKIVWRLISALALTLLLYYVLDSFEKRGQMSTEGRRWFNLITILLSSLIALTFGSLMGLLGSMVRWHLLAARRGHSLADVSHQLVWFKG
jgi:hypothetical protein